LDLELGASSAPPGPEADHLQQWLDEGRHGEMRWLERDPARRADPRLVLDGARSVVSIGMPYYQGSLPSGSPDRPTGRIARYALGDDYHDVMLAKVREVAALLDDPDARPYVDTGPVMEKPRAQQAGLGWTGKHTNLVSRRHGSWHFLGAVVTRVEVEPSDPHEDQCGTCRSCLDVCPTGAIDPENPYEIDARRCISYLTIELRGPIPRDLRPLIGTWIFGCDLCLDVCPWNRFAEPTREERFRPRDELVAPVLEDLLAWDQATFSRVLKGSSIKRTKRRGLLRNVAVALGNAGDRGAIPTLARTLAEESEPLIRGHAAWALGVLGGPAAHAALLSARSDPDPYVCEEVEAALAG
jgi:epoxyqueuosine reductase